MSSLKKKVVTIVTAFMLAWGGVLATAPVASASVAVDMNLACQTNMHNTSWAAKLVYPSQGAYGWRCWNRAYPEQYWLGPFFGVDVNYYCNVVWGSSAYTTNPSNAYSWRCN